jgi:hypothetical protein
LIRLGDKKKALDMVNLFFTNFPLSKFTVDMDDVYFTDLYYRTGEIEKANKRALQIAKIYEENLEYYFSFTGSFADAYKEEIQMDLEMLHNLQMEATGNKQDNVSKQIEAIFNREVAKFKQ